ncbi:hypothetical protein Tco_1511156 [Tanacetum coccineum]
MCSFALMQTHKISADGCGFSGRDAIISLETNIGCSKTITLQPVSEPKENVAIDVLDGILESNGKNHIHTPILAILFYVMTENQCLDTTLNKRSEITVINSAAACLQLQMADKGTKRKKPREGGNENRGKKI